MPDSGNIRSGMRLRGHRGCLTSSKSNTDRSESFLLSRHMVGGFCLHQEFDVPVNAVSLRLGVEDERNRRLGTVEISLPVPPAPEQAGLHAKTLPDIEPD